MTTLEDAFQSKSDYSKFKEELTMLLNKHSLDARISAPDHVLSDMLATHLERAYSLSQGVHDVDARRFALYVDRLD